MFAYCMNNPTNMVDSVGALPKFLIEFVEEVGELVDTIFGTLYYITEYTKKGELKEYWVGEDAKVYWSRHYTNHGNSKEHPLVPHDHEWYDDDDGNNTENSKWEPPNPGFQAPDSNKDDSTKAVIGTVGTVVVGYGIYATIKWAVALFSAPVTGGGSLIIAGVTP